MPTKTPGHTLRYLRQYARFSHEKCAELCNCTLGTWKRWESTEGPRYAETLLAIVGCGDLSVIDSEWQGWRLFKGKLSDPSDYSYTHGDILSRHIDWQIIRELRRRTRELEQENAKLAALFQGSTNDPIIVKLMDQLWK